MVPDRADAASTAAMAALAHGLADPTRLAVMQLLAAEGPHTVPDIALAVGVFGSRLGNHLAKLRRVGLVTVTHRSRQAIYAVSMDQVGGLLGALQEVAAATSDPPGTGQAMPQHDGGTSQHDGETSQHDGDGLADPADLRSMVSARSCYGHLGGHLGVAVFEHLLHAGAIVLPAEPADAVEVRLGAPDAFLRLGVDPSQLEAGRRRFAYCCLDWSENLPHLGGVLGDALLDSMLEREQLTRMPRSRALRITKRGRRELAAIQG